MHQRLEVVSRGLRSCAAQFLSEVLRGPGGAPFVPCPRPGRGGAVVKLLRVVERLGAAGLVVGGWGVCVSGREMGGQQSVPIDGELRCFVMLP